MAHAVAEAAIEAGLPIVLLPAAYHRGGWDGGDLPPAAGQRRFCDPDVEAFLARVDALRSVGGSVRGRRVGVAAHSVRAVPRSWLEAIAEYSERHGIVRHVHAHEQRRELAECQAEHGCSPIELLERTGFLGPAGDRDPRDPRVGCGRRVARPQRYDGCLLPDHRGQPRRRVPAGDGLRGGGRAARDRQRLTGADRPVRGGARARDRLAGASASSGSGLLAAVGDLWTESVPERLPQPRRRRRPRAADDRDRSRPSGSARGRSRRSAARAGYVRVGGGRDAWRWGAIR